MKLLISLFLFFSLTHSLWACDIAASIPKLEQFLFECSGDWFSGSVQKYNSARRVTYYELYSIVTKMANQEAEFNESIGSKTPMNGLNKFLFDKDLPQCIQLQKDINTIGPGIELEVKKDDNTATGIFFALLPHNCHSKIILMHKIY